VNTVDTSERGRGEENNANERERGEDNNASEREREERTTTQV